MAAAVYQSGGSLVLHQVYRHTIFTFLGQQMAMTSVNFQLNSLTGTGGDDLGDASLQLMAGMSNAWKLAVSTAATMVGSKLAQVGPGPLPLPGIATDGGVCSGGSSPLPQQVSGIIKNTTARGGRAFRGRSYVPFPYAAAVDTDYTPTAAYVTKLGTIAADWINTTTITIAGSTYTFIPVIYHRKAGKSGVPAANTFDYVVGTVAEKEWATQRRRGDFGRVNPDVIH